MQYYHSIKIYTKSHEKLLTIRESLREHGVYMNKSQVLDYAISQLNRSLQKIKNDKNENA